MSRVLKRGHYKKRKGERKRERKPEDKDEGK